MLTLIHRRLIALSLLCLLFLGSQPAFAQKSFYWDDFDVSIRLNEDGTLDVTEQQTLVFEGEPFTFGFATIPKNRLSAINNISVREQDVVFREDFSRQPNTYQVADRGDEVRIDWYFAPTTGRHTYTFSYTVEGAVRVEDDGNQILWMAIPSDIPGSVRNSSVSIQLPPGVTAGATTALINGSESNRVVTTLSDDGRWVLFDVQQALKPGDTLEAGVRFPLDQLALPVPNWQRAEQRADVLGLTVLLFSFLLLIGGTLFVIGLWYLRGRDPQPLMDAEYVTEPPPGLSPAVLGSLIDEEVNLHDVIAGIVDLARRGYIQIEEEKKDHNYQRTEKPSDDLAPYERELIKALFGSKQSRRLKELSNKFYAKLPTLQRKLYEELVTQGFFHRSPQGVRGAYRALGFVAVGFSVLLFVMLPALFDGVPTAVCGGVALFVPAILLVAIAGAMPRKTQKGADAAAHARAFRTYLKDVDKYENLAEAKEIFEKYLPYAIAFGIERTWIQKFKKVPATPMPTWYAPYYPRYPTSGRTPTSSRSGGGPRAGGGLPSGGERPTLEGMTEGMTGGLEAMSGGLTRMLDSTNTVLRSRPAPKSSSGGFSGGGFSGGFSGGSSGGGSRGFG